MDQKELNDKLNIKHDTHILLLRLGKIVRSSTYNKEYKTFVDKTSLDHLGYLIDKNIDLIIKNDTLSETCLAKIHRNIGYVQAVLHCMGANHIDKEIEFCRDLFTLDF